MSKLKIYYFIAVVLAFSLPIFAQSKKKAMPKPRPQKIQTAAFTLTEAYQQRLIEQAEECGKAFIANDIPRLIDFTYPKIIALLGGRAKAIAGIKSQVAQMKAEGFEMEAYEVAAPTQVLKTGQNILALLPITLKIKVPDGKLAGKDSMLGISTDEGANWTFLSGAQLNAANVNILFPTAGDALKFPPKEPPTFYPNAPTGTKN